MADSIPYATPTRLSAAIFFGKAMLFQLQRSVQDLSRPIQCHGQRADEQFTRLLAESATLLWTDTNPAEAWYQRGKIQNLRVATRRLHLCIIPAGAIFSFWKQVGRASTDKGYVPGRMLQEGCMIPAVGGGLCQLSNAIYQVALDAGCEIVERHQHSRVVPGSATNAGRDATVAWNYIDLRLRPSCAMQLRVMLTPAELLVSLYAVDGYSLSQVCVVPAAFKAPAVRGILGDYACESCGNTTCFRHAPAAVHLASKSRTAYLLDAAWPEFIYYVKSHHRSTDVLAIPMDGNRWNRPAYAWPTEGYATTHTATLTTLLRAARSRRLSSQGAKRQGALEESAAALARQLGKALTPEVDEVYVSHAFLPFLWRAGALGGRRFRVLMTQLPARALQAALDRAYGTHPESTTLHDFRAEQWLVDAEEEALLHAESVVTAHAHIASFFRAKTELLEWSMPAGGHRSMQASRTGSRSILLPSSTLGRKGVYELREAIRGLNLKLLLGGPVLEAEHFWDGFDAERADKSTAYATDLVVLPAILESQPRSLLRALAAGTPVITTAESGLHPDCGAKFVRALDASALRIAVCSHFEGVQ